MSLIRSSSVGNSSISNSWSIAPEDTVDIDISSDEDEILEKSERGSTTTAATTTTRSSTNSKASWVWMHFKRIKGKNAHALCLICLLYKDMEYGDAGETYQAISYLNLSRSIEDG